MLRAALSNPSTMASVPHALTILFNLIAVRLTWSANTYDKHLGLRPNGRNEAFEEDLKRVFPPLQLPINFVAKDPLVIVDCEDRILAWYLPNVLTKNRQVCFNVSSPPDYKNFSQQLIWRANGWLQSSFKGGNENGNWRSRKYLFRAATLCEFSNPGDVNISPGWFEQGHYVSKYNLAHTDAHIQLGQTF